MAKQQQQTVNPTPLCISEFKEILTELDEDGFDADMFLSAYEDFVTAVEESDWTRTERDVITGLLNRARDLASENDLDEDEELREPEQIYVVDEEDLLERETSRTEELSDTMYDPDVVSIDDLESAGDDGDFSPSW